MDTELFEQKRTKLWKDLVRAISEYENHMDFRLGGIHIEKGIYTITSFERNESIEKQPHRDTNVWNKIYTGLVSILSARKGEYDGN